MRLYSIVPNKCSILLLGPEIIPNSTAMSRLNSWELLPFRDLGTEQIRSVLTESIRYEPVTATDIGKILVQTEPDQERTEEAANLTIWKPPQGYTISQYKSPVKRIPVTCFE